MYFNICIFFCDVDIFKFIIIIIIIIIIIKFKFLNNHVKKIHVATTALTPKEYSKH